MRETHQPDNDQRQDQLIAAAAHREAQPIPTPPVGEGRAVRDDREDEEPERWDGMS